MSCVCVCVVASSCCLVALQEILTRLVLLLVFAVTATSEEAQYFYLCYIHITLVGCTVTVRSRSGESQKKERKISVLDLLDSCRVRKKRRSYR